ncbi:macrophage mannose receptor 1-like [Ostrea edulis]|uniref:macrophage mannose receptor 1-like n=1 Tax=Ostrea edulis TaxID=37623 RepID=UPI0020949473|nr:macrophage mannose receptor 1-like [Ostrea edulis]
MLSIVLLIYIIDAICYINTSDRSAFFDGVNISSSQISSLQPFLLWETKCTSTQRCAVRCLETITCLSFIKHRQSGVCQLFSANVNITSGIASPDTKIYHKQVSCEELGYISLTSTKKCLKLYATPTLSWIDANSTCASAGGKLFSISSASMFSDVLNAIAQYDSTFKTFFIDGNDIEAETNWVFSDGSSMSFLPWDNGQPNLRNNEDCMLVINEKYHDAPCTIYLQKFICEREFTMTL